ncbi:hypothetical protein ADU20_17345 [Burkholderia pseudomallei]|nr:hypothetical protein ADU20_17345 [Burkholderia pseudomallei]
MPVVREVSNDIRDDGSCISFGQSHRAAPRHLDCKGLEVVSLPSVYRGRLQCVSMFISLFL